MLNLKLSTLDINKCKSFWKVVDYNNYADIAWNNYNLDLSIVYNDYDCFANYFHDDKEIVFNPKDYYIRNKNCNDKIIWALSFYHELGHAISIKENIYCKDIVKSFYEKHCFTTIEKWILEINAWKIGLKEGIKNNAFTKKDIKDSINFIKSCISTYKK